MEDTIFAGLRPEVIPPVAIEGGAGNAEPTFGARGGGTENDGGGTFIEGKLLSIVLFVNTPPFICDKLLWRVEFEEGPVLESTELIGSV